jgi:putative peptide zinc metalloprotease protein
MRRWAVLVATWAFVAAGAPLATGAVAHADGFAESTNNYVYVYNTTDNALRSRAGATVAHAPGNTVANQNIAYAKASCTGCRTVAVAVQVVIVEGAGTDFRPANAAVALNENCTSCQTFAFARQFVLSPHHQVSISEQTQRQVNSIQQQMSSRARSQEPFPQLEADLDSLSQQMLAAVQADLNRTGGSGEEHEDKKVDEHS